MPLLVVSRLPQVPERVRLGPFFEQRQMPSRWLALEAGMEAVALRLLFLEAAEALLALALAAERLELVQLAVVARLQPARLGCQRQAVAAVGLLVSPAEAPPMLRAPPKEWAALLALRDCSTQMLHPLLGAGVDRSV